MIDNYEREIIKPGGKSIDEILNFKLSDISCVRVITSTADRFSFFYGDEKIAATSYMQVDKMIKKGYVLDDKYAQFTLNRAKRMLKNNRFALTLSDQYGARIYTGSGREGANHQNKKVIYIMWQDLDYRIHKLKKIKEKIQKN